MATYRIDFSTNASRVAKEIDRVNQAIAEAVKDVKPVEIQLDSSGFSGQLNTTFKQLDKEIAKYQRQLRKLQIGTPQFGLRAAQIGQLEGERQQAQMTARAIGLRAAASAFPPESFAGLSRKLEAAKITASKVQPNTESWVNLQREIARLNLDLQKADKLAENVQLTEQLGAFAPGSLNALEAKLTILRNRAREISPETKEWRELNKEIGNIERNINKQTRRLTKGQRLGAAGGAFLYGGGFSGIGSALGGVAGGLAGGVPGAFTGAAVGQAVDSLGAMAFAMTEQANAVRRMRLGLAGASTDLQDFAQANETVAEISNRLLIPLGDAYRQFTRLRASTAALGIDTKTTGEIFEGVSISVMKAGGSMEDVDGAMRAVSQVFSKGKVQAEELRGQLGERLPGAVVKFAQQNKIALQDLDKAFEAGQVSVDQFVTFARGLLKEGEGATDSFAKNQEFASARYQKALERMQLAVGRAIGPMLNSLQDFAAEAITQILKVMGKMEEFASFMENRFGGGKGGASSVFLGEGAQNIADRIIGGDVEVKDLEDRTKFFQQKIREAESQLRSIQSGQYKDNRNIFERMFGGPGEESLRKGLPNQINFYKKQLAELVKAGEVAESKMKGGTAAVTGATEDPAAAQRASQFLGLIEKREESLAQARQSYEEDIASIRANAIKQAETLERRYQDQRIQAEREIARTRRQIAASQTEQGLLRRELASGVSGEDPALIEQERRIGEIIRDFTEEKISLEEKAQQEQLNLSRELEDFKRQNADAINKANERYAKAIGEIQKNYAKSVAKLIEEGSGLGAKKLAAAGKLLAAQIARASAQQAFVAASGAAIIPRGSGMYEVAGQQMTEAQLLAAAEQSSPATKTAAKSFVDATRQIEQAQKGLSSVLGQTARAVPTATTTTNVGDIYGGVEAASAGLRGAIEGQLRAGGQLNEATILEKALGLLNQQTEEGRKRVQQIDQENRLLDEQITMIKEGTLPALAEQEAIQERRLLLERNLIHNAAKQYEEQINAIQGLDEATRQRILGSISKELERQLAIVNQQAAQYKQLTQYQRDLQSALRQTSLMDEAARLRSPLGQERLVELLQSGVSPAQAQAEFQTEKTNERLRTLREGFQGLSSEINTGFAEALTNIATDFENLQQHGLNFIQTMANAFKSLANTIIQEMTRAMINKAVSSLFNLVMPAIGSFAGGAQIGQQVNMPTGVGIGAGNGILQNAGGQGFGTFGPNFGIRQFATGGLVTGPTLGLIGEGRFNEAVVPMPNGKSIPVDLGGAAGSNISTNIVVNMNNGQASSQMTGSGGQALGRELEGAVRSVLLKESRPGGIIYSQR